MIRLFVLGFAICFLACSCSRKSKVEQALKGWWSIDTIYYGNQDLITCLNCNSLYLFKDGRKSEIPATSNYCDLSIHNGHTKFAEVKVLESGIPNDTIPFRLEIITKNGMFAGIHKIVFYKDEENQLLKMEIFSDSLYVVCRKGLFNFRKNVRLIDELEAISWTSRPRLRQPI